MKKRRKPKGSLTAAQLEILDVVWNADAEGATVQEVWREIADRRSLSRTTVLNQMDRLEKRGWLHRKPRDGIAHYAATVPREEALSSLAGEFVNDFFGGSASHLVLSLLGTERIDRAEIERLETLLSEAKRHAGARRSRP